MTEDHPNAAAYRQAADAFRARDLARIEALVDPHVVWHVPGNHPRAGDIRGRDALLAWLAGMTEVGFWLTEHDVFANDEHVCALSYMGARGPGIDVQTRVVSIFHFRDGRQAERWFFPEDPVAWDRILGGTSS
jgi:ketosteroid isomerase-like protein